MNGHSSASGSTWRQSRYGFAGFCFLSLLAGWLVLRVVLLCAFKPASLPVGEVVLVFLSGFHRDIFAALIEILPLLIWLFIIPDRSFGATWHRILFICGSVAFGFAQIFLLFVEFFFFEEFKSRFNTVAVDYLYYPQEVFVNIWQSYHVGVVLGICLALSLCWVWAASRLFFQMFEIPCPAKSRLLHLAAVAVLAALLAVTLGLNGANLNTKPGWRSMLGFVTQALKSPHVSKDRTLNELANNGALAFFSAAWTRHLDYSAFYKTLPLDQAYERTRRRLAEGGSQFEAAGQTIRRKVAGDAARPRLNVVIFLEESLGTEFWGCLGRPGPTLTPEMDRLALQEGLLFTNLYACGNRTVRGMEGVLSSFPPLPGDSIVKRDLSDNVETIARVLKRDGYATVFLYGGRGWFDGMGSFALRNGYERFIEHNPPFHDDFPNSAFATVWGVCDEDLFMRAVAELHELSNTNRPFFATLLSTSNHKPFTYPKGKIPEDPDQRRRENAVKYSDYALGRFFDAAKKESFWTNTIFAVVADHGARVYGSQSIPIHSYEIPLVILGPAVVKSPARISQLGSSLDVSPTLLGLIGRPYETLFFGHDLLQGRPDAGRALLNHNRDIGMLARDRLVVLGLMQTVEFYQGDPKTVEMSPLLQPSEADRELEKDTIAIFQVADDLYMHQRYRIDER